MDKLMKERLSLRDEQLKQLCAAATDITNRAQTEGVSLEELTTVKVKLMTATKKFEEDFFKLIKCSPNLDIKEQERYTLNQMKAEDLSAELETVCQLNCQNVASNKTQIMRTKLPKLELMKFNGDILKWPEFWDKFESNIHNQPMSKTDKLSYLFSSLEGRALDTLRGIDITNNGYDVAVNILKDRFGDKSLVVDAHYEALSRLPQSSNDYLRSTLDAIIKHIRILDSLGEDSKGNHLRSLICSKFPKNIIYELNLITPKDRDLDMTVKGLEKIINAKEREWPASKPENLPSLAEEVLMISEGPEMAGKGYEDIFDTQFPEQDTNDVETSMKEIIDLQAKYFPDEVAGKRTSLSRNLDLFRDVDGTLRCGGRMKNAEWSYESKHPILIPKLCDFTNSIILRTHQDNYHVGVSHTLSLIRKMYWIPQGRAQVKQILKTCPQCVKHSGGPYRLPDAPDLPVERVTFSVPFTFTGMDYFGPIFVEVSEKKEKRWVCLFTCLAVRAIHLEVVNDLTAEECLLAVRRFVACRGKPSLIVSDNATQFRLTSEIFIDRQCARSNIKWKFIPQLAPWHGGVYERLIGVVKNCLKRTLDKHLLKEGQLMTIIKEVETVVNSRPLTTLTPEIEHILRPADFLTLGKCLELIPPDDTSEGTSTKIDLVKSWKRGQRIMQDFKLMFRDQYLPSLRERYFQRPKQPRITSGKSPRVGDLVQIKDDSRNRLNWRVGKISTLVESQDGKCRVAKVQVGNQVFTRSIAHLYPLEAEVGSIERVPTTGNHTDQVPKEREPRFEVETPEVACDADIITEGEVNGPHSIPRSTEGEAVVREPFIEESTEISASEADKVANRVTDGRVRREAAIRARERIAEWTQQLFILL
ncbi:uncharacterized protein LOC126379949 isoform X4 [Pectinophora gossypiella]|nr:uncharacterized protein LOC126379949 isoform X4 [Pectinophora gossypiella]